MAVSTKTIIDDVAKVLNDTNFNYWSKEDLLAALNDGVTQTVILKPDASVTAKEYRLSGGVRQSLPDGSAAFKDSGDNTLPKASKLLKVVMNMGTTGLVPGNGISIIDMDLLSAVRPDWAASSRANAVTQHYMYDEKDPKHFWVTPPQPSSSQGYVLVVYNSFPTACAAYSATEYIPLADEYVEALRYYMLFRAYSRDTDAADANKALMYYDAFKLALGLHNQIERSEDPNFKDTTSSASYERR